MTKINKYKVLAAATVTSLATIFGATSCNESSGIGQSIVNEDVQIVVDSSFTITGHSYADDVILSRTIMQMIGAVDIPEYGSISSEVVTQFMPALVLDTAGVTEQSVDSLKLIFQLNLNQYVGDELAPVGLEVYPLTKQLSTPMYSNFDPEGYYDPEKCIGSLIYNVSAAGQSDSIQKLKYRTLYIDLPVELGRQLFREYKKNPASFGSPSAFAKIFPGLYIKNTYGGGRITRIAQTTMRMYYHRTFKTEAGRDTTQYKIGNYFAVTPEIISNNGITLSIAPSIENKVKAGETILLAPAGYDIELTFPAREIISAYRNAGTDIKVINNLELHLPVEQIPNKFDITPPTDVLLVLKKDKDKFFLDNKTPDNITSFRATYNCSTSAYTFSELRQYITDLLKKETITADDLTFCLVPITVETETNSDYYGNSTTLVTGITPYVTEPKMAKILLDKAKITFVYSKQTINF